MGIESRFWLWDRRKRYGKHFAPASGIFELQGYVELIGLDRYGDEMEYMTSNSMLPTIRIPSRLLQTYNLEILISSIPNQYATANPPQGLEEIQDAAVVPMLETPRSFGNDVSFIRHPVHQTVILGTGIKGCLAIGPWVSAIAHGSGEGNKGTKPALDLPHLSEPAGSSNSVSGLTILKLQAASEALDLFRENNGNAVEYEQGWSLSGLPDMSRWLEIGVHDSALNIKPAVQCLVRDLIERTSRSLLREEGRRVQELTLKSPAEASVLALQKALEEWAARSHTELRNRLDAMLSDSNWGKLRWWKLLWRVDDVSLILTDLLERNWLVEADKGVAWLAGRGARAGTFADLTYATAAPFGPDQSDPTVHGQGSTQTDASLQTESGAYESLGENGSWLSIISRERASLRARTIPPLQTQAHTLVAQGASVAGLSLALSGLIYVSFPALTIYEAGAVAALGLGWSMRHVQKSWEGMRTLWAMDLKERGRHALRDTEEGLKTAILRGANSRPDAGEAADRAKARDAVEQARQSLAQVTGEKKG